MTVDELRALALDLREHALGAVSGRAMRSAANELVAIADALDAGGAVVGTYAVVPIAESGDFQVRGVPIPPPPLAGKHRRPAEAQS